MRLGEAVALSLPLSLREVSMSNDNRDSRDEIARLAYERFCGRSQVHGSDVEDWLAAERAVEARRPSAPPDDMNRSRTNRSNRPNRRKRA